VSVKSAACELSHILTPSIYSSLFIFDLLWSQPVLQVGKQVVVAWSEIRAARRMVRQFPVEMLQQCSSASSCMRARIVMEEHCTGCKHSMPFVLEWSCAVSLVFRNTLLILLWSLVVWIQPPPLRHQLSGIQQLFKLFWFVWWMCVHPLLQLLFCFSIHKWNPGYITCYLYDVIEKFIPIFVVLL
jgi:hypothetical protein